MIRISVKKIESISISVLCYIFMLVSGVKNCSVHNELMGLWCCGPGVVGRSVPESPGPLFSLNLPLITNQMIFNRIVM